MGLRFKLVVGAFVALALFIAVPGNRFHPNLGI